MADVTKIDIDGVQWSIKDQEARNKITVLEEKTTVKVTKKIDTNNIKMNLVEINGEKFIQIHIQSYLWDGVIGGEIANFENDFNIKVTYRLSVIISPIDRSDRIGGMLDINPDGTLKMYAFSIGSVEGPYKESRVNGDAFIRINI